MRIAVMTDAHANLPALQAALNDVRQRGCDAVIHTGDAIAIGPQPAECVELLLSTPEAICLLGNHDLWYLEGLPAPQPAWMSDGEVEHQHWTHAQLNQVPDLCEAMLGWALTLERDYMGVRARFQHAPLRTADGSREFTSIPRDADGATLDALFGAQYAALVCFGHDHREWDMQGSARYLSAGPLGCYTQPLARYLIISFTNSQFTVERHAVAYDDASLRRAFVERSVPERAFIDRAFFGGRLGIAD